MPTGQAVGRCNSAEVVLDFAEVTFMDSSGLGLLVDSLKLLRDKGGRLARARTLQPR